MAASRRRQAAKNGNARKPNEMRANKLKELPQQLIQMKGSGGQDKQFACGHKTKRENEFRFLSVMEARSGLKGECSGGSTYPGLGAILLIVAIPPIDSLQAFQQAGQRGAFFCLASLWESREKRAEIELVRGIPLGGWFAYSLFYSQQFAYSSRGTRHIWIGL